MGMEVSFFSSCPLRNAPAGPDKSGHRSPCSIIVKSALRVCPDLRGTLKPPVMGHDEKKDTSMPIVSLRVTILHRAKAGIRFQRAKMLLFIYFLETPLSS
jgi:hypothetical protein